MATTPIIIRGTYAGRTFIPDEPMPDTEGSAELRVVPEQPAASGSGTHSAWDAVGKLPLEQQRSREDIDAQVRDERESWGDR